MRRFINLAQNERNLIITNTAEKKNLSEAIIEKDYWVTWTLNYLFSQFKYKDFFCFKGGTSLSKVYHMIERFSEDIDLSMDWALLDIDIYNAYESRSNRQQDIFNKNIGKKTEQFMEQVLLPLINNDFSVLLSDKYELYIDEVDKQTICFQYPQFYKDSTILQVIRLEIGVLAEPIPANLLTIKSYISESYPSILIEDTVSIMTVDIKRTFFEKITILHREVCRINNNYPKRYSRHFYDLYKMIIKGVGEESLSHLNILEKVVYFKHKFYPCNWAHYDDVMCGKCRLVPCEQAISYYRDDYIAMRGMIYGQYPSFDEIINTLSLYENILNKSILAFILETPYRK